MDNKEHLQQSSELPRPQPNTVPSSVEGSQEFGAYNEQKTVSGSVPDPTASTQADLSAQATAVGVQTAADPLQAHTSHLGASDIDLIENEWVRKAKAIVADTHGDPYKQNKEINKIKADYIKKRYNKDIKQE